MFLKYAGGKRKLVPELVELLPKDMYQYRYVEPMVGGGALYFAIGGVVKSAVLADSNAALINTYRCVRQKPTQLSRLVKTLLDDHTKDLYLEIREQFNAKPGLPLELPVFHVEQAAWFVYLNRTCFNGLYRVNKAGEFNVPMGKYKSFPDLIPLIYAASNAFRSDNVELQCQDFEETCADLAKHDFVYFDPPYMPVSKTSNFTSYTNGGFGPTEQTRLSAVCNELDKRGAKWMLSNSAHPLIRDLYKGYDIQTVQAPRMINSKGSGRGLVDELIIRNYT